jgi:hypothetical protein
VAGSRIPHPQPIDRGAQAPRRVVHQLGDLHDVHQTVAATGVRLTQRWTNFVYVVKRDPSATA